MGYATADRVQETSTSTGTGDIALSGAVAGFRTFASIPGISVGDILPYEIEGVDTNGIPTGEWETGLGTYSATNTLARTTVFASSNNGSPVSFSSGWKRVALTHLAVLGKWTAISSVSPSGVATVDFTSLDLSPYADLLVVYDGLTNTGGGTWGINISVSDGSTFSAATSAIPTAITGGVAVQGGTFLPAFRMNRGTSSSFGGAEAASPNIKAGGTGLNWRATGGIKGLRVSPTSGNFNGGTLLLMGR